MSHAPAAAPHCRQCEQTDAIELVIESRARDLGGFGVRRLLPTATRRHVGPIVFLDHMGPANMPVGGGIDVPPHPHISLATVTYLFEGEIVHRDSLGTHQPVRPGAINWMTAGRGITHSERTSADERARGPRLHGVQLWVALPIEHEETEPTFQHHPETVIPEVVRDGVRLRILAGTAFDRTSPVDTLSPLFYVDATMVAGGELRVPDTFTERAAYVVDGVVHCGAERVEPSTMLVFRESAHATLRAESDARVMLLGGEPLEGERHMWWNFVSSSKERIESAKRQWRDGRFPVVPGDTAQPTPLPER